MCVRVSVDGHSAKEGVRVPELELGSCESSVMGAMNCTGVLQRRKEGNINFRIYVSKDESSKPEAAAEGQCRDRRVCSSRRPHLCLPLSSR